MRSELERAADWRGNPIASNKREFLRVLEKLRPSKEDVFFDLGCGYAQPCVWIAPKVKLAVGIENHYYRYMRAKRETEKSGFPNIRILWDDIERVSYRNATILYSVIYVGFSIMKKIQRQSASGTRVVLYGVPPYPLRTRKLFGRFHIMTTPFERVGDGDEFARIYLGRKRSQMKDLIKSLDREQAADLKWEMRTAEENWDSLRVKSCAVS